MADYKVIQDVESEDKLVGPLTLRQFIYAAVAAIFCFVAFKFLLVNVFLIIPFLPIIALFAVLATPFGHDQPNEIWLLAKAKFLLKPKIRIWKQGETSELVTITAPKRPVGKAGIKNITASQARSKLQELANTIDTRGWSSKNVNINLSDQSTDIFASPDRLVSPSRLPQPVPNFDISAADDILDPNNNAQAQKFNQMIATSGENYKQKVVDNMISQTTDGSSKKTNSTPWFGESRSSLEPNKISRFDSSDDKSTTKQAGDTSSQKSSGTDQATSSTDPAILGLALANKDNWSVATIAREAKQAKEQPPQNEVVIPLH